MTAYLPPIETLTSVTVEGGYVSWEPIYGQDDDGNPDMVGEILVIDPAFEATLSPAMRATLTLVGQAVDTIRCYSNACPSENPVGWVLHEDDEHPSGGGLRWAYTALVEHNGRAIAVCEDCDPATVYDRLFGAPQEAQS